MFYIAAIYAKSCYTTDSCSGCSGLQDNMRWSGCSPLEEKNRKIWQLVANVDIDFWVQREIIVHYDLCDVLQLVMEKAHVYWVHVANVCHDLSSSHLHEYSAGRWCVICEMHLSSYLQWSTLQWLHNERDGVSNHQPHDCLLNSLFRRRSKKKKLRVTGLCKGNSPVTGEFPAQRAINAENVPIWWRHYELCLWDSYNSACTISPKCIANCSIYLIRRRCGISTVNGLLNICFALNILQSSPTNIMIVI